MKKEIILLFAIIFLVKIEIIAQTDSVKWESSINCDITSKYIWRGLIMDPAPNIQPGLTIERGGFSVGAWGSYGIGNGFSEADIFASYNYKNFTLTLYDYFNPDDTIYNNNYFEYDDEYTGHLIEPTLEYKGGENFPIKLAASVFVYGADKDTSGDNYYSTYFELGYDFLIKDNTVELFAGFTPKEGFYGEYEGVMNAGLNAYRDIKISDDFTMPMKFSLVTNPQRENIYFVFTFSF